MTLKICQNAREKQYLILEQRVWYPPLGLSVPVSKKCLHLMESIMKKCLDK